MSEARKGLADPTASTRQATLRKRKERARIKEQGLTRRDIKLTDAEYAEVKAFVAKMRGKK